MSFQRALAALPRNHPFRGITTLFIGISQFTDGDMWAANRTLDTLMRSSAKQADAFYLCMTLLYLGLATLLQGRMDDALNLCDQAAQHLVGYGDDDLEARIHLIKGKVCYERNDLDGALDHLRRGISLRYDPAPFLFEGYPTLAYIHLARGNAATAQQVMEQSIAEWTEAQVEKRLLWAWTGRQIRAHQVRLWLLIGNIELSSAWARDLERHADAAAGSGNGPPTYVREWEQIVLARVYLAESRARDALALLDKLRAQAENDGRAARVLEILVLQAVAYDALGDAPAALMTLQQALALGALEGFVRTFVEGGPAIQRLIEVLQAERTQRGK
ncbi:MAG: tetratricopeptide repeat protein, partial [Ktedonobacterales bacterium]